LAEAIQPGSIRGKKDYFSDFGKATWTPALQALVIIVATVAIFWPVLHGDWLWDDDTDITKNSVTQSAGGLWSIWFSPGTQLDYYPVKASVQWAQWHLWGNDTFGYHVTNLILHIVSALLVWRLFHGLELKFAWLGGLIFAIHPALVESVAWIAELKNTLSMPFFLFSMIFYLQYEQSGRRTHYFFSLGLFLLAMLTKPSMVMWPAALLLYVWWKRRRVGWDDVRASAPFFAVSLLLGVVTLSMTSWYKYLHHQGPDPIPLDGIFSRIALMGLTLAFYFGKAIWPVGLLPIYPQWPVYPPALMEFIPWPVMGGSLFWFWTARQSWGRGALFGFGFFLLMLVPFSGVAPASFMTFTWVMDHFLYIPILGLIGLALAGLEQVERHLSPPVRYGGIGALVVIFGAMIMESRNYAEKFVSQEALWSYTLGHYPDAWLPYNNLGLILSRKGQVDAAIFDYQKALEINPNYAEARNNLGSVLLQRGQMNGALLQFQKAVEINPSYAEAYNNLGVTFARQGRLDEAMGPLQKALELNPDYFEAHYNLGAIFLQKKKADEAVAQFQDALQLDPNNGQAQKSLAEARKMKSRNER